MILVNVKSENDVGESGNFTITVVIKTTYHYLAAVYVKMAVAIFKAQLVLHTFFLRKSGLHLIHGILYIYA